MGDQPPSEADCSGDVRNGTGGCCVVLVSPGRARPESLLKDLTEQGARLRVVDDPVHVMVELAHQQGRTAIVIAGSQQTRRLPKLLAAVRHYYPQVACWRYETINGNGQAQLELLQKEMPPKEPAVDQVLLAALQKNNSVSTQPENGQQLEKAPSVKKGATPEPSGRGLDEPDRDASGALPDALLTPEELSMLMGPDFADADQPGDGNDSDESWSP